MSDTMAAVADGKSSSSHTPPAKVFLVSYPKIIFLYPSILWALFAGIYLSFWGDGKLDPAQGTPVTLTAIFLIILAVNMVVLSFDFPRMTSLTLFFVVVAAVLGGWLLFTFRPGLWPQLHDLIQGIRPLANSTFFFIFSAILGTMFLLVAITSQFDYWEVRPNELLHHHGILSDLKRYPAPSLKLDKETNDVFEYLLLRSGRLILHPSSEPRAFVLDNVIFINRKEAAITRMLGALQVQIRPE